MKRWHLNCDLKNEEKPAREEWEEECLSPREQHV